ncbi:hypothetical protein IU500_21570 [Nocardia terpenica]|uniref:hypothetical protein n=1 Tax=Nocardia terpenica TaxID=455432 RepID=UPI0018948ECE|nr:hypothetical protein [Nocardia terpenica]MBF6064294.1 hypothetical protein [Nocardia terpenica]MBF6106627.1 hypothetical protein [Nocardia terpenica]MBF6113912.1 hypothetical protein [Nocardia terpenica]MBF6120464.1 hypothetical protein [Nocardia terpenica]MBF6154879.1 hypothetical protein [Nocardia terpenica]
MHTFTAIVASLGKVTLIALVLGAGLPLIFAVGIRFWSMEPAADAAVTRRPTAAQAVAYLCFAVVVLAVVLGILYIAKDFISHTVNVQLFGARPKK